MRFHIIGSGPIGGLVAFHLRRYLRPKDLVSLIHRDHQHCDLAIQKGGNIQVESNRIVRVASGFFHETFDSFVDDSIRKSRIDSLIIATKAQHTLSILRQLLPRLTPSSTIVLMQNGMGVYEETVEKLFTDPANRPHFVVAVNTHGAWLKGALNVVHAGQGAIKLGIMPDGRGRDFEANPTQDNPLYPGALPTINHLQLRDISTLATDSAEENHYRSLRNTISVLSSLEALNVEWRPIHEVEMAMRVKLVVNSFVNTMTAIMGCRNGNLLASSHGYRILEQVCQEAHNVFKAQWEAERRQQDVEDTSLVTDTLFPPALEPRLLENECKRVIDVTKNNISSTLQDVRAKRGTEMKYITGYLMDLAEKYQVEVPTHKLLWEMLELRRSIPFGALL
ncbi:ketopantoate reductase-like protein [Abortiporus biennis]|nr:ketopantoate reductase-like protein [Abortiporus biennis]